MNLRQTFIVMTAMLLTACEPTEQKETCPAEKASVAPDTTTVVMRGESIAVVGQQPQVGSLAPDFTAVKNDLSDLTLASLKGKRVVLNIFPSIDTGVCAQSVRSFNERAAELDNTVVLCLSKDLPFAQARFCGAEGIDKVETLSLFRNDDFDLDYGVRIASGALQGLLARAVVVIDAEGKIVYHELVANISQEPNYDAAIQALL